MQIIRILVLICPVVLFMMCASPPRTDVEWNRLIHETLEYAVSQLGKSVEMVQDSTAFPRRVEGDQWHTVGASDWTSGFFPGCLWYAYEITEDDYFKIHAERWTAGLVDQQFNDGTHDTGFMMFCSYGNGYRLTKNPDYKAVLLQTAETLAGRFNPTVGCIKSWDWMKSQDFPVIIDNMMNLELLFWASKNGGDKVWYDIAVKHADTTLRNHLREDGSSFHVLNYNPQTGQVLEKKTHQGAADQSAWARGQAWGIYGFTMTYRETGETRFLDAAQYMADFFIRNLPEDHIPFWDFDAPNIPDEPKDASAAAIAASGLLELCQLCESPDRQNNYLNAAKSILHQLASDPYLTTYFGKPSVLDHAVGSKPENSEVDVPIVYADYYFIESLLRLRKMLRAEGPGSKI